MKETFLSERLHMEPISAHDAEFIFDLLNSEGWLEFIGNRNINSVADALTYIEKIEKNPDVNCWIVKLTDTKTKIGMISLVQRDYLDFKDVGFAFLSSYGGKGYAYESASTALSYFAEGKGNFYIHAVTVPENIRSIKIIEKLGLSFEKTIEIANETLSLYGAFIS